MDSQDANSTRPGTGPDEPDGLLCVEVSDTQTHLPVDAAAIASLARGVLAAEGVRRASISVAVVDNAGIHELNRRHLDHDWPTDVISFPLSDAGEPELQGELVVSAEMALETARACGAEPPEELALYLVHGLLHLCGYDDLTERDAAVMRRREADHLARMGIRNTYPLVGRRAGQADGAGRGGERWPA